MLRAYNLQSPEHLLAKETLAQYLQQHLAVYTAVVVEVDYLMPEVGVEGRVADIAVVFPSGYVLVYQCQLERIGYKELRKRTKEYADAGVDVIWWLGGQANIADNRNWCEIENCFGEAYSITFDANDIQLPKPILAIHPEPESVKTLRHELLSSYVNINLFDSLESQEQSRQEKAKQIEDRVIHSAINAFDIFRRAIYQTINTWNSLSKEQLVRGLIGTEHGRLAINGIIGQLNNKKVVTKTNDGKWLFKDRDKLYSAYTLSSPKKKLFDEAGIDAMKRRAKAIAVTKKEMQSSK